MLDNGVVHEGIKNKIRLYGPKAVQMDRSYLKAWRTFLDRTKDVDVQMK